MIQEKVGQINKTKCLQYIIMFHVMIIIMIETWYLNIHKSVNVLLFL